MMFRFFLFFISVLLLFSSCSDENAERKYDALLSDSLSILSPEQKEAYLETKFPEGIAPYLITVDSIDERMPGVSANELFEKVAGLYPEEEIFEDRGFLIILSQKPSLIQIRAGSKIKYIAQWKGITAGPDYMKIQQTAYNDSLNEALVQLLDFLEIRLPEITSISMREKMNYNQAMGIIGDELEEFGFPSDSFYGNQILKPILKLRLLEYNKMGTWWLTYFIVALIVFVLNKILSRGLKYFTKKITINGLGSLINTFTTFFIGIYLSLPVLGSAVILSGGRLEDALALQASGIPLTDYLSISTESYGIGAAWWLIVILMFMRILKGVGKNAHILTLSRLPDEYQHNTYLELEKKDLFTASMIKGMATKGQYFEDVLSENEFLEKPFTHAFYNHINKQTIKATFWGLLATVFFSKAIVMAVIFLWLFPVIEGYISYVTTLKKFNRKNPEYQMNLSILFAVPIAFFAFAGILQFITMFSSYFKLALLSLLSSGILTSVLVTKSLFPLQGWQLWLISLVIPVYYLVRIVGALFQTGEKLKRAFIQYLVVTFISFAILLVLYFQFPDYQVRNTVVDLYPKSAEIIKERKLKQGLVNANVLNVREGAGTKFKVLIKISRKDTFNILETNGDWWYIECKDTKGYISAKYAKEIPIEND